MSDAGPGGDEPARAYDSPEAGAEGGGDVAGGTDALRLFVAIMPPPATGEFLSALLSRLQAGARFTGAHPSWSPLENIHLTLAFLGSQPVARLADIKDACLAATASSRGLSLRMSGLDLFPTPREPKVISVGLKGDLAELARLRDGLASQLRSRGIQFSDKGDFRPHVTLARIKSVKGLPGLRSLVASHQRLASAPLPVESIALCSSTLARGGAIHQALLRAPLAPE